MEFTNPASVLMSEPARLDKTNVTALLEVLTLLRAVNQTLVSPQVWQICCKARLRLLWILMHSDTSPLELMRLQVEMDVLRRYLSPELRPLQ
jgi:hypothetical protein